MCLPMLPEPVKPTSSTGSLEKPTIQTFDIRFRTEPGFLSNRSVSYSRRTDEKVSRFANLKIKIKKGHAMDFGSPATSRECVH
jgi:hypothetical protein